MARTPPAEARPAEARPAPRLMAIWDRATSALPLDDWARMLAASGVDTAQVRDKGLDDRDLLSAVRAARRAAPKRLAILVNGRLDVALAAGAQGVHLPADGLPTAALRRRFGPRVVIGRSTHSLDEIRAARDQGADFVTFGPIHDTPSKRAYGPPQGLGALARAARLGLPVLALGGIGAGELAAAAAAGAAGAAGIRAFRDAAATRRMVAAAAAAWSGQERRGTLAPPAASSEDRRAMS